jgi:hypothetical protein
VISLACYAAGSQLRSTVRTVDCNFGPDANLKLHANSKNFIKFLGIPSNVDLVQVVPLNSKSGELRILGKTSKSISSDNRGASAVFGVQIANKPNNKTLSLQVKTFIKEGMGYKNIEKFIVNIEPVICSSEYIPVCAILSFNDGNKTSTLREEFVTYTNECEMERSGAEFVHEGACQD